MKNALNNCQIAGWLRKAADDLFDAAQNLNRFRVQGREAELEEDLLERVVNLLEPCRTPPMPVKIPGHGFQSLQPLKLTQELLGEIGLRREDESLLAARVALIEESPEKIVSSGMESIIEQLRQKDAPPALVQSIRNALAKLALLRNYLQTPAA
jgi:hypothetical protein